MRKFKVLFASLLRDESGSEMIECALVLALLALVSIAPIHYFGNKLAQVWASISSTL